ncbi:MAG: hypothetical protein ACREMY_26390 [bacterium]
MNAHSVTVEPADPAVGFTAGDVQRAARVMFDHGADLTAPIKVQLRLNGRIKSLTFQVPVADDSPAHPFPPCPTCGRAGFHAQDCDRAWQP